MEKVLYVATYGDFFASFQIENMKLWQTFGCEVHCVANFHEKQYNRFTERIDKIGAIRHDIDFLRSPYSLKNIKLYKQLKQLMLKEKITIVDTHNPVASILSRIAAKSCGIKKVVYTVHGFFFYKGAPLKNNLIYKPIENIMARFTDVLIVTNLEDFEATKKMQVRGKAYYVHGVGVDVSDIINITVDWKQKRSEFGIPEDAFVLCSVGECIKRKNHESALRAFARVVEDKMYYILIGDGILYDYLKELANELDIQDRVIFLGYRSDANEILKICDLYVFPSYQEGLSVALMQAMAAQLPVVASEIRGNIDCIENGKGGITVAPDDVEGMGRAIIKLKNNPVLRKNYGEFNLKKVDLFSKSVVKEENKKIFSTLLGKEDTR